MPTVLTDDETNLILETRRDRGRRLLEVEAYRKRLLEYLVELSRSVAATEAVGNQARGPLRLVTEGARSITQAVKAFERANAPRRVAGILKREGRLSEDVDDRAVDKELERALLDAEAAVGYLVTWMRDLAAIRRELEKPTRAARRSVRRSGSRRLR
jgi:hypothetical protein